MLTNYLEKLDVYKMNHMVMYRPGTNKVYSCLVNRSNKTFEKHVFFGLQYYLKEYLTKEISPWMAEAFIDTHDFIVGPTPQDVKDKVRALANLGYWPLEIKAVHEGTVVPAKNVLMTITNTLPEFYWTVGFVESLILKLWYTSVVATTSFHYREVVRDYMNKTSDLAGTAYEDFMVHDFGYRGDGSEEGAMISGMAHLTSFKGSDTVPAFRGAMHYYNSKPHDIMHSVPASEHSVMCSYGREDEIAAFSRMLELYPTGIVSIVSDTFNVYNVLTNFAERLKGQILGRDGKTVFRPDSGNPEHIIGGNPAADEGSLEWKGCIRLLDEKFGHTINSKGYKVLNPKVGLIYGDGMYLERYKRTLARLEDLGYSAENLIIGVGGILRNHSRDTLGSAIKATYIEVDGVPMEIEKDPITDPGKKSPKGLVSLFSKDGKFYTVDQCTHEIECMSLLEPVFRDGKILREDSMDLIRERVRSAL